MNNNFAGFKSKYNEKEKKQFLISQINSFMANKLSQPIH